MYSITILIWQTDALTPVNLWGTVLLTASVAAQLVSATEMLHIMFDVRSK